MASASRRLVASTICTIGSIRSTYPRTAANKPFHARNHPQQSFRAQYRPLVEGPISRDFFASEGTSSAGTSRECGRSGEHQRSDRALYLTAAMAGLRQASNRVALARHRALMRRYPRAPKADLARLSIDMQPLCQRSE